MGRLQEAIAPLRQATQIDPKLEPPRALLGFCYFQMTDFESARREFKIAIQLNPRDGNVKLFLARSMLELDDVQGALRLLEQLRREAPHNAEVLYSLGTIYASLAQETLGAIQTADPNSYLIDLLLGKYAEVKQVFPEAVIHYRKAIEKAPAVLDLYYRLAHAYWEAGDFANALKAYQYTIKVNPYDDRACWEAARLMLADDPQEAYRLADRALQLKPNIPEALTIRGRAALALQKPADAVEDLKKASKLAPEDATNHFQLARAYRQLGMTHLAEDETAIYVKMQSEAHSPKEDQQNPPAPQ
jgi:tetratricopeptide (TPR) repeat protein